MMCVRIDRILYNKGGKVMKSHDELFFVRRRGIAVRVPEQSSIPLSYCQYNIVRASAGHKSRQTYQLLYWLSAGGLSLTLVVVSL